MSVIRTHQYRRARLGQRRHGTPGGGPSKTVLGFMLAPIFLLLMAGGIGLVGGGAAYYTGVTADAKSPPDAIAARGGGARIFDRNGTLLYEFLDDKTGLRDPVTLDQVSPYIKDATIAAEDASFYSNPGVNPRGLARAAIENFKPGDEFLQGTGGSSITQQLVKQLYFTQEEREERTVSRKLREAALAVDMTRDYSKDQILEWYLNEIPYGGVLIGVQSAAKGYFGVNADQVTLAQAAFIAGLPQSPSDYDPFTQYDKAIGRQQEVLDLMVKHKLITPELGAWAKLEKIELHPAPHPFLAPHWVEYVADYIRSTMGEDALYHGGLDVLTTLDLNLNDKVNAILEQNLELYEKSSNGHNGAVVIINPPTGQILAMVGSRDYNREDVQGQVNNAIALNSPGSTLKPFTYATTFMHGWGPDWPIVDTPITYVDGADTPFSPRNPDGRTRGVIPLKQALGNSFNIPAFKAILWVGVPEVVKTAKAMGITTLDRQLGPALTLGGVDVKLLDMVYGYSTFANNGVMVGVPAVGGLPEGNRKLDPVPVIAIKNRKGDLIVNNANPKQEKVIDPEYAWMISDILSTDENRQITYGRGSNLNIPGYKVATKTGTSEPYENSRLIGDTWTFGYTPDIAVGVWVGNSDNSPMVNILSTTIAGATWNQAIKAALEGRPARDFQRPPGIETATVCVPSGRPPVEGKPCASVTGLFATQAIAHNDDLWWGGRELSEPSDVDSRAVPRGLDRWQQYLANEYLRSFSGRGRPVSAQPTPVAPPPAAPPPQPGGGGNGNNGNGNGNGNGRR